MLLIAGKRRRSDDTMATNLPAATASFAKQTFAGAFAMSRSVAERVHTSLDNLTASAEARRQQIEQQRLLQHEAVDARAAALQALVRDESALRTSHLERQLIDTDKADDALRAEQSVFESPSAVLTQRIALLPSIAVDVDTIAVQLDPAPVLYAISQFGVVFGAQPATMLFDKGFALLLGRDGKKDAVAAFTTFEDAAVHGNTTAMGYAATQLYRGFGIKQDKVRAQQIYTEAAKHGDLYSRAMVIVLNKRAAEYGKALSLVRHAASTGHVLAEYFLGVCFQKGIGCDINNQAAVEWFQRSADQSYAIAQSALAMCYYSGTGVQKDRVKAASLYELAADQGFALAQFNVGVSFEKGEGVEKDPVRAAVWCRRAADQGYARAQLFIGNYFETSVKDVVHAAVWYRRAADQSNAAAQNILGICYRLGTGVDKDPVQAAMWFTRAAEQGDAIAQQNLGSLFYHGDGVSKDYVQAVKWFTLAAAQGRASAHYYMGLCYSKGRGVAKCLVHAVSSLQCAADLGNDNAMQCLVNIQAVL
jgi:uncharacterized protein